MLNNLQVITDIKDISIDQWETLNDSNFANFFHTQEVFHFFKQCGFDPFIIAIKDSNNIRALVSGIIQKEKGILKSFLSRRAIIYSGPVLNKNITNEELNLLLSSLIRYLKRKAIYIEIRNFNNYSIYKSIFFSAGFQYHAHLNFHVDCTSDQEITKKISKSKLRQIKKSFNARAEIIEAQSEKDVLEFYSILKRLYQEKVKTPLFPKSFFIEFFKQNLGKYLLVKYNKKILGGIMCPIFQNRIIYEWFICGEDGKYKGIYPSVLATWAAMGYANKNNIALFDFMGAGKPNEDYGVREFKSKFGGEQVEYGRFLYISKPFLFGLGKLAVKIIKIFT